MAKVPRMTVAAVMRLAAGLAADIQHAVDSAPVNAAPAAGDTRTAMLRRWCETQKGVFNSAAAAEWLGLRRAFCTTMFHEWKVAGYLEVTGTLNRGQSHGSVLYRRVRKAP